MNTQKALLNLKVGETVYYLPPSERPHSGSRATVQRAPRADVKTPSVRLEFPDGTLLTAPLSHVRRTSPKADTPAFLTDARSRPAWTRLVTALRGEASPAQQQDGEARARQLAGMVAPRGSEKAAKLDVARVLLEAAQAEAQTADAQQPGRGGKGQPKAQPLSPPTLNTNVERLDQDQRAMINSIAKCIHRRYFLSDREVRDLSEAEREAAGVRSVIGQLIGLGLRDVGGAEGGSRSAPKPSELHALAQDTLTRAYPLSLEACQMLLSGKADHAFTLATQVQELRLTALAAQRELDRTRTQYHTGRYFHGDVLSVREEHEDGGMTQYYVRLTIIYGEDGHSVLVANAAEIESLTGLRVGAHGWASLCRWIEDHSERAGGRKQGRRQADDERMIYRDDRNYLVLREGINQDLVRAFDTIRCAMVLDDVNPLDIPNTHPTPGLHPAKRRDTKTEGR
ncbi:hypothetical protein [Deinococcus humi]|uniref:Uncharacterized protein n=1 Tax=Deinococcus humi TaxID=662880 RepID=A0A7W8JSG9_9DEIO|nr:hypothetical protein [Deinococcus humi]MBB5362095.1 hypothetical protein [Deinococcus humi]GGO22087.1 hypothetical protein GCM10008949_09010 [Deinococcus humi]